MEQVKINNKDIIIMNLTHYFITEQNYNPVIVHGINDEIWLENMNSDYKIIRIVSKYIHNNEQLNFDKFRSRQITKKLKKKTFSFKMNVLNIYIDLGDNVTNISSEDNKDVSVFISKVSDIGKSVMKEIFPDIVEKTRHEEKGMDFLFKITDDINVSNEKKNKTMEKIFSSKKPIITYIIMALCLLMFIITGMGVNTLTLVRYGANVGSLVKSGEVYRLITYMFLHAGIIHIFFNMYSLYVVGPRVEDFYGRWKFLLIYIFSGISGGLLSVSLNGDAISVGASGAIFGLFGALLYFGYNYRGYIGSMIKSQILPIVIYNLVIGFFISGIDMWGHVGGLIGGILTSYMLGTIENKKYSFSNILVFLIYFGFLIYLAIFR
ncbi:MAG: rhomboid family intramembrane serine protease [Bacilli bacterium]|nr:rhomboid family intramembrane serine protease [Bacilli bacterium]